GSGRTVRPWVSASPVHFRSQRWNSEDCIPPGPQSIGLGAWPSNQADVGRGEHTMKNIININFLKRNRLLSVLGLALDGSRLQGVVIRRSNGSLQVGQRFAVSLSLDPLTNDPDLVGREILNHLEEAGVRERHCVVGLPLKWVLA